MKPVVRLPFLALLLLLSSTTLAQSSKIMFPAGGPEDVALQNISRESDAQKRKALLLEFVQKFSDNPAAVAYGCSQLSQQALADGDVAGALAYGDKALAAMPDNLDILVAQVTAAQQAKDNAKLVDYAARGGKGWNQAGPKPDAVSEEDFRQQVKQRQAETQSAYDFLEAAAYNAIVAEPDPKRRMQYIELFTPAFPGSRFEDQVSQYALYTLQQLNDSPRLLAYGEKALKANPKSVPTLVMLASGLAEDPKNTNLGKPIEYARRAIELTREGPAESERSRRLSAGEAHSALGYALMRQEKTLAAIPEFKTASDLLKGDPAAHAGVLFRLGWAYAKLKRYAEARAVLLQASNIPGPHQPAVRDLLAKINAAQGSKR